MLSDMCPLLTKAAKRILNYFHSRIVELTFSVIRELLDKKMARQMLRPMLPYKQ